MENPAASGLVEPQVSAENKCKTKFEAVSHTKSVIIHIIMYLL